MNADELTGKFCCVKYSLMACNAFGIMLGIFVVMFGLAYPEENFPGGYRGKESAGISGFFIIFTIIGYYGAHRQKVYFLVPYSIIIFLFLGGNLVMWAIRPEDSVLDPDSNTVYILGGVFVVVMVFALFLAYQEKEKNSAQAQVNVSTNGYPQLPLNGLEKPLNQVDLVYQTGSNQYVTVPRGFNGIPMAMPMPMPLPMTGPVVMY